MGKLIIEGNQVYELDEQCLKDKAQRKKRQTAVHEPAGGNGRTPQPRQTRRPGR